MNIRVSHGAPRNKRTFFYALLASAMLVAMLLAQLFEFEDFPIILSPIVSATDSNLLTVLAVSVVLGELLALPYLLGMYLGTLMRVVSALTGFGIAGFWLLTALTNAHADNSGLFSGSFQVPGGLVAAIWCLGLFSLVCKVIFADSRFRHATS